MRGQVQTEPRDNEIKIFLKNGQFTIIPSANRDNFVRLNGNNISYIENKKAPLVAAPLKAKKTKEAEPPAEPSPDMSWSKKALLDRAKELKITYKNPAVISKAVVLSDILTA